MIQGVILIGISLIVAFFAFINLLKYKKISNNGKETEGVIFDTESSLDANNSTTIYPVN